MSEPTMTSRVATLSAKEKETLRLLAHGHDAKSLARHLGLSIHTVNERLRDARRKLAVSSSREAARQLREAEGDTPDSLGDKPLGDAPGAASAHPARHSASGRGDWRRAGWVAGGTAMMIALALLAQSAMPDQAAPNAMPAPTMSAAPASPTRASEAAAVDAARRFLALLDRDDWAASWQATHRSFQLLNTVDWWAQASRKVRGEVGTPLGRELATVDFAPAPPDGYWTVAFKARYSRKGDVTETLQLASQGKGWRVVGITVE